MSASPPPEEGAALQHRKQPHAAPAALRPSLAFLHLLSPYLKLGALLLPSSGLPLSHGLPALLLCAAAAALANYLTFMLGRYFRKPDWEGVVLEVFARGHGPTKERTRGILRSAVRLGAGALRVCIAAIYVRKSVHAFGNSFSMFLSRPAAVVCAVILVAPFSYARSPTARTVTCATVGSVLAYLAWLGCISYAYAHGTLDSNTGYIQLGTLWQGITVTAFAFTSSFSLPAFKSTPTSALSTATPRPTRRRLLRTLAVILAVLLLLPSVLFAAFPHPPPPGIPRGRFYNSLPQPCISPRSSSAFPPS
ncbi:hypothetical protein BD779DRAFT_1672939 [Infundibulicybe gibba]|nr:hypothetical protein BD779DRAFT_1672939 [Infundibulicybe gibba]